MAVDEGTIKASHCIIQGRIPERVQKRVGFQLGYISMQPPQGSDKALISESRARFYWTSIF